MGFNEVTGVNKSAVRDIYGHIFIKRKKITPDLIIIYNKTQKIFQAINTHIY